MSSHGREHVNHVFHFALLLTWQRTCKLCLSFHPSLYIAENVLIMSFSSSLFLHGGEHVTVARLGVFALAAEVVEATVAVVYESAFAEYVDHVWTDGRFKLLKCQFYNFVSFIELIEIVNI